MMETPPFLLRPQIFTTNLRHYTTIIAPRPILLPTKPEIRSAVRCCRSGMVPGAIRKYLLQRKKKEEEADEGGDEEDDEDSNDNNNQGNNVVEEEEEEVKFIACFPSPPISSPSAEESPETPSPEEGPLAAEELNNSPRTREEYDHVEGDREVSGKRCYNDAFINMSPDTTTPDTEPIIIIHEIERSEIIQRTPPAKRRKIGGGDATPKNVAKRSKGKPSAVVNEDTMDSFPAPAVAASSSSPSCSSIPGPWVRQVLQENEPSSKYTQELGNAKLDKDVKKNNWKNVLDAFHKLLGENKIPYSNHLGDLIKRAILTIGTRVSRDVPKTALNFFSKLVKEYPLGITDKPTEYYCSAFTNTTNEECSMAEFLFTVLQRISADADADVDSMALPFFKIMTKMVINQYKDYESSSVKLRRPFFVQFLEEQDRIMSYNDYCKKLVKYIFRLKDFAEQFKAVMRWVGLLSYHLRKQPQLDAEFQALVQDFGDMLSKSENSASTCQVVQAIADPALGSAVCLYILSKKIMFTCVNGQDAPNGEEIEEYFKQIAKNDLILGLHQGCVKERRSSDSSPLQVSSHFQGAKKLNKTLNRKGESYLHKLCGKDIKGSVAQKLDTCLKQRNVHVNPTDNFGNTPLHDAIAHNRLDAVIKFYDYCSDLTLPEELRVNLLAQNDGGDTPFHLAAISPESEKLVPLLTIFADKLQVKNEALKTLNHQGKMPFEMAFNNNTRAALKPEKVSELQASVGNVRVLPGSRMELQSLETKKLVLFWAEFKKQEDK